MDLKGINIGLAVTGSFCTFDRLEPEICRLIKLGANLYPIFFRKCAEHGFPFWEHRRFYKPNQRSFRQ